MDASGPPGLPSLLLRAPEMSVTTVISALSFSPDGEVYLMSLFALMPEITVLVLVTNAVVVSWYFLKS